jgi:SNF2 family DNA or RNA helicase
MRETLVEKLVARAAGAVEYGSRREAVALFKKVLEYDRHHPLALDFLIAYYEERGDYRRAARYLRLLGDALGPDAELLLTLAGFYRSAGDVPAAIGTYGELLNVVGRAKTGPKRDLRRFAEWQIATLAEELNRSPRTRVRPAPSPKKPSSPAPSKSATAAVLAKDGGSAQTGHEPRAEGRRPAPHRRREEPIAVKTVLAGADWRSLFESQPVSPLDHYRLRLDFHRLTLLRDYDELICFSSLQGVENFWYQIETVKKVLRDFGGRVLLADEVGLGKTIEAAMSLKEFMLRGLARKVLILTPPALVAQWKEELSSKFGLTFVTTDELDPTKPSTFWDGDLLLASLNVAKSRAHFDDVTARHYDLVIVDEAHHLKNRETLNWKLVSRLKSKYLFLLSATPVQNNLIELFNIVTLLKPGTLKTEAAFRNEYVKRGKPHEPSHPEKLRELLRGVMVRNTRSLVDLKLPRRFAVTVAVDSSPLEREIYEAVSDLVREAGEDNDLPDHKTLFTTLLREAGSSPFALEETLAAYASPKVLCLLELVRSVRDTEKGLRLMRLLAEKPGEKVIVFSQFRKTLEYLARLLEGHGIPSVVYHGGLTREKKDQSVLDFRHRATVMLATESGGEGHNLQFAHTLVNYDLPWNPMRIEQRIGRLHRVGQTRDVFIFNFCSKDTLEHYLVEVLEKKINLFELVIGEIDMILGNLDDGREFGDIVFDLWKTARDREDAQARFEKFGDQLVAARDRYRDSKRLDDALFREEFEV